MPVCHFREVMTELFDTDRNAFVAYIGLDKLSGSYRWLDGDTTEPNLWYINEPGSEDCVMMSNANPQSGFDVACTTNMRYFCERAAQ